MGITVCLPKHGDSGLGENLVADKVRHFRGHVHIGNAGFGRLQVLGLCGQIGDRVLKAILGCANSARILSFSMMASLT